MKTSLKKKAGSGNRRWLNVLSRRMLPKQLLRWMAIGSMIVLSVLGIGFNVSDILFHVRTYLMVYKNSV